MSREEYAAIGWSQHDEDGPSFGWNHAKVVCDKCDGWEGTTCPNGCGVRLVSTQAEHDERLREAMAQRAEERRRWRAEWRARRDAS